MSLLYSKCCAYLIFFPSRRVLSFPGFVLSIESKKIQFGSVWMKNKMSALPVHLGHHWVNEWSFNEGVPSSLMRVVDVLHLSRKDLSFQVLFCWMINKQMQFVLVGSKNRVSAFQCSFRSSLTSEVTTRVRSRRYCASLTLSIQVERISLSRLFFSVGFFGAWRGSLPVQSPVTWVLPCSMYWTQCDCSIFITQWVNHWALAWVCVL